MIRLEEMALEEAAHLPPLSSTIETDRVLRLDRLGDGLNLGWRLTEEERSSTFRKIYDRGSVDDLLASYEDSLPRASTRIVAAHSEEELVGRMAYCAQAWNNTVWLLDIRVHRLWQRRGVGTLLVEHVKRETQKQARRGITVETQTNNLPALRFYIGQGFEISGFNDHLYGNDDRRRNDVALFLFWEGPLEEQVRADYHDFGTSHSVVTGQVLHGGGWTCPRLWTRSLAGRSLNAALRSRNRLTE